MVANNEKDFKFLAEGNQPDLDYFTQVIMDSSSVRVNVTWGFDEQQADAFHHNFSGAEFMRRLARLIGNIHQAKKRSILEGNIKKVHVGGQNEVKNQG